MNRIQSRGIIFVTIALFGGGILLGLDTLVPQAFGAGHIEDCHRSLLASIYLSLPLAGVLIGLSKLLTLREAAQLLGVKLSTLRAWRLRRKHLPFVTVGACVRVSADAVQRLIESNTTPPREERR